MICRVCGSAMTVDALVVGDAIRGIEPGEAVPIVYRCINGHSARMASLQRAIPTVASRLVPRCAVCGVEVQRRPGAASRKTCGREHANFVEQKRAEAAKMHHAVIGGPFTFLIEAQPWYRGASIAFQPKKTKPVVVPVVWPVFPEIPAAWLDGFRSVYPLLEPEPDLAIFPPLDEPAMRVFQTTERHARRRGRRRGGVNGAIPTPSIRSGWPHP